MQWASRWFSARWTAPRAAEEAVAPEWPVAGQLLVTLGRQASGLGREVAEVCGALAETKRTSVEQSDVLRKLTQQGERVATAQDQIGVATRVARQAVGGACEALAAVEAEVSDVVGALKNVSSVASEISRIALQTRLVAFNASVEAARAGEAGRGFGVVASAVKDLAESVEVSSQQIVEVLVQLDSRVGAVVAQVRRRPFGTDQSPLHAKLDSIVESVDGICAAADASKDDCSVLDEQIKGMGGRLSRGAEVLDQTVRRTDVFLGVSEQLVQLAAAFGVETEDSPFIRAVQNAARSIEAAMEEGILQGETTSDALFDADYLAVPNTDPPMYVTAFTEFADRWFPSVQEQTVQSNERIVCCVVTDRNGYVPRHNDKYNQIPRPGDPGWNAGNCRSRRIFDDRSGLASARSVNPFLLQIYRRDMGGGNFVLLKEVCAPVTVRGRHWGAVRLLYPI